MRIWTVYTQECFWASMVRVATDDAASGTRGRRRRRRANRARMKETREEDAHRSKRCRALFRRLRALGSRGEAPGEDDVGKAPRGENPHERRRGSTRRDARERRDGERARERRACAWSRSGAVAVLVAVAVVFGTTADAGRRQEEGDETHAETPRFDERWRCERRESFISTCGRPARMWW